MTEACLQFIFKTIIFTFLLDSLHNIKRGVGKITSLLSARFCSVFYSYKTETETSKHYTLT
jgi:hypothetical protein